MNKTLAILGAGELGKQIANFALADSHYRAVLFYDDFNEGTGIEGNSASLETDYNNKKYDELIIGIGYNHPVARKEKFDFFQGKIPFGTIIHSSCWIDKAAKIEAGCVIYPRCTIDKNVTIQSNTILNLNCTIAHDSKIGAHTFFGPAVAVAGFCSIGDLSFIGIGSVIKDTIALCDSVMIGAGAIVIHNITEKGVYAGNPAKKIK